jgi:hypothetical protein
MDEELSPQFMTGVQVISAITGLTLAFKEKVGDEALEITKNFSEQMGTMMGENIKKEANITGSGIEDMEKVFHAWLDAMGGGIKINVESNKMTSVREHPAMCPAITVSNQMNVPLEIVCNTVANPVFRGIAKSVNPDAVYTNVQISEEKCIDTIEIP